MDLDAVSIRQIIGIIPIAAVTLIQNHLLRHINAEDFHEYVDLDDDLICLKMNRLRNFIIKNDSQTGKEFSIAELKEGEYFSEMAFITIILFVLQYFVKTPSRLTPLEEILYAWGILILDTLPFIYLLWRMKRPMRTYGITTAGWKKA